MRTGSFRQNSIRLPHNTMDWPMASGLKSNGKIPYLIFLPPLFAKASNLFKQAVNAIVNFAQSGYGGKLGGSGHKDIFDDEEAAVIKSTMIDIAGKDGDHKAVGNWLVQVAQKVGKLAEEEIYRTQKEVDDVASGKYDWRIKTNHHIKI